ncbi:MAG: hypothetical protein WD601_13645, partial [Pseudohongiellaceae bacterium]
YASTRQFLDYFNLETLDQLPTLNEIRDMEEAVNPELSLNEEQGEGRVLEYPDEANTEQEQSEPETLLEEEAVIALATRPLQDILGQPEAAEEDDSEPRDADANDSPEQKPGQKA